MIAKGRYMRGATGNAASHLNAHFKYIEHRSREVDESREDRAIFSRDSDSVNRREAVDEVMEHTSSRVSYHQIILSPGEDEPVQDWREWTREVMADLEDLQNKDLYWYAVHHSNTEHEHVHVVVAGSGEDRETGQEETVKLFPQDYQVLRESGHDHSESEFYYRLEALVQEYDKQDETLAIADHVMHLSERDPLVDTDTLSPEEGERDR